MELPGNLVELGARYGERLLAGLAAAGRYTLKKFGAELAWETRAAHVNYANALIERYAKLKTFFIKTEPTPLYEFYVPSAITVGKSHLTEKVGVADVSRIGNRIVITGTGGSGKTILMRHLLLDCLSKAEWMPVFIELRALDATGTSLKEAIYRLFQEHNFGLTNAYVDRLMESGALAILLDGYDEVELDARRKIERQITDIARGTNCLVIVSSRPDSHIDSWSGFIQVEIASLSLEHACELVDKVPFEEGTKDKFVAELKDGLYRKHQYFLSNPLLLSIMLLTYSDSAAIPTRITTFYQLAYEALYQRHDALKFGYKRSRRTTLDMNEFAILFSAFSLVTYDAGKFKFPYEYAHRAANKASKIVGVDVNADAFTDDARQAVCLMIDDGLEVAFVHRSFQEYFTAKFISEVGSDHQRKLIEKYSNKNMMEFSFDRVLDLLYELNPSVVERFWLIPALDKVFPGRTARVRVGYKTWFALISASFKTLRFPGDSTIMTDRNASRYLLNTLSFVFRNCLSDVERYTGIEGYCSRTSKEFVKKWRAQYKSIRLADFSFNDEIMRELSEVSATHSKLGLEKARRAYIAMLDRQKNRETQLDAIFG